MSADTPTRPIPVAIQRRKRRKRGLVVLAVVLVVLVIAVVVAYVIGERVFRQTAETQIERSVELNRPEGVTGTVDATIGGGSALLQWVQGSFDDVTITSRNLHIQGASSSAVVHVKGLPVDGGAIDGATATVTVGQAAFKSVPQLQDVGASAPKIGNGTVSTTLTKTLLGLDLKVTVLLKPSLSGTTLHLNTFSATITAGSASIPATAIVQQLLPNGVSVCTAQYLPKGLSVTSVRFVQGEAVVGLKAGAIDLQNLGGGTGSCS